MTDKIGAVERSSLNHLVDTMQSFVQVGGITGLEAAQNRQKILQIVEAVFLILIGIFDRSKLVDLPLDSRLPDGQRVELGLCVNDSLIRPAHRDELADKRHLKIAVRRCRRIRVLVEPLLHHMDKVEITVHLLVFCEGSRQNQLRN